MSMADLLAAFNSFRQEFNSFRQESWTKLDKLQDGAQKADKKLSAVGRALGCVIKRDLRKSIGELQGIDFATELTLFSLENLAYLILEAKLAKRPPAMEVQGAALTLASELQSKCIPELFVKRTYELIPKSPGTDKCLEVLTSSVTGISWDGSPDPAKLKALISGLQPQSLPPASATAHPSGSSSGSSAGGRPSIASGGAPSGKCHKLLRDILGSLAQYFEKGSPAEQQQYLLSVSVKGSFGIQMAVYGASVACFGAIQEIRYDDSNLQPAAKYSELVLPSARVQMDVRGSITVYETKALINLGEIKRSDKDYGAAKQQLKEKLGLLQWAVKVLYPEVTVFVLVGHIYFLQDLAISKRKDCSEEDKVAFYVHYL